jgi:hypothetical protein
MENKITYARGQEEINPLEKITFIDAKGNEYRISFDRDNGLIINKLEGEIYVCPKVSNEIKVF